MRSFSVIIGHFLGAVVLALGILWALTHVSVLPDHKLIVIMAALNILALNHLRWHRLSRKQDGVEATAKVNHLVITHYMILILFCGVLDFTP